MVSYKIVYTKQAIKDIKKIQASKFEKKVKELLEILKLNPFQTPPRYEKLIGDLQGAYSRRINIQHRLVYQVFEIEKTIKIIRLWTHYE
jgi:Txe/YoeB family toxin of toxin-antitoxin system